MTVEYRKGIAERYQRLGYPIYRWFHADDCKQAAIASGALAP
jgi:hypothetical protein